MLFTLHFLGTYLPIGIWPLNARVTKSYAPQCEDICGWLGTSSGRINRGFRTPYDG